MPENRKNRSTELYHSPLEGSTIFLYRSSLGRTSMESYRLAELKYAIFSGTGRKTKKFRGLKFFLSTVSKHGLLEGSTFLFQYSSITRTSLESSQLGELKYAISAGLDVILKNKIIRKCKKRHCAESAHGHCIVDRFGQVWSCCFDTPHGLPPNFTHALNICLGRFLSPFQSARLTGRASF